MVCLLKESRKYLGLTREQTLFVTGQGIPIFDVFGFGTQVGVRRYDTEFLLPCNGFGANCIPTCVELTFVFIRPLLGHMVRCVNSPGRVVHEERFVRRHRLLSLHPLDRLICHVNGEVIALRLRWGDPGNAVVDQGEPLIGLAPDESVELVKSLACRPSVEGPRYTCLPSGSLMPLTESTCAISIQSEHLGQGSHTVGNLPSVAGKTR